MSGDHRYLISDLSSFRSDDIKDLDHRKAWKPSLDHRMIWKRSLDLSFDGHPHFDGTALLGLCALPIIYKYPSS